MHDYLKKLNTFFTSHNITKPGKIELIHEVCLQLKSLPCITPSTHLCLAAISTQVMIFNIDISLQIDQQDFKDQPN